MASAQTAAPRITAFELEGIAEGDPAELAPEADLEGSEYADLTLEHLALPAALIVECRFAGVTAEETDLVGARLVEVEFDRVHLTVVRAGRGEWRDVRVSGRLGAVEAYDAQWRSVRFSNCKVSYANLRSADLVDVEFVGCVIEELDLTAAIARRVRFRDTRVARLNVQHSTLADVDLRGATLEIVDGLANLRGTTISPEQFALLAPLLADHLGLRVEEHPTPT